MNLGRKVDIHKQEEINDKKADKTELIETQNMLENLNDRVKHLANLQNELALNLEPVRNSINQFEENRRKKLLNNV